MDATLTTRRTADHKPALAVFAAVGSVWVFVLVTLGAFTTSIGAGMVFADWPLSNGSVNPHGWLEDISMFAEHSHRLTGTIMGVITISLAVWLARTEDRRWLRQLGWWAVGIVVFQGLLGGTRVLLDAVAVPGFQMSLGQMLRIPHGVMAQIYVCLLIAIAVASSKWWIERTTGLQPAVQRAGLVCCALLLVQLTIAAVMRHNAAGLAIPTFPESTPDGRWLPVDWNFRVAIHFAHRAMAVVIGVVLIWFASAVRRDANATRVMRLVAAVVVNLLVVQIVLGAQIIWTFRRASMTTAHVVVGALLLASTFWLTWVAHRDAIERKTTA
ncbi:MAG: COX15/CtaA family protein [Opitutaceae bacterium]|nr:COX15/CtaA family protein [Opitutaceae bacterium]